MKIVIRAQVILKLTSLYFFIPVFVSLGFGFECCGQELNKYEFSQGKMGTIFRIVLYSSSEEVAVMASEAAFSRIDEINEIFSDYIQDSEISMLSNSSGSGNYISVSPEMWKVLNIALDLSEKSQGAFDITIGPLSKLWRRSIRRNEFPEEENLSDAKSLVSYRFISLDSQQRKVNLTKKGMRLDAGGIAKGFAVDEAYKVLESFGLHSAVIDGGGDIYMGAPPTDKIHWDIRLLENTGTPFESFPESESLSHTAIAASGDTYRHIMHEGRWYSHIVDPRTGYGVADRPVIFVVAPNCTLADALASALSVMEYNEREAFIGKFEGCRMFIVDKENEMEVTRR